MTSTPASANQTQKPAESKVAPAKSQESYLDQLERAGYRNLTVDQMIAMKIHDVTPESIAEIKSLGWSATPDQLVAFRIHGVNAETVKELRALGISLIRIRQLRRVSMASRRLTQMDSKKRD